MQKVESIGRSNALPASLVSTEPPSFGEAIGRPLVENTQELSATERQLVRPLGFVVVNGLC